MDLERKRVVAATTRNAVVAGSVWESRMKSDQVKGGIKVFNGEEEEEENPQENHATQNTTTTNNPSSTHNELQVYKRQRPKQSLATSSGAGAGGKRKTWKSDTPNSDGFEKNRIHIAQQKSEKKKKNSAEQKSPIQVNKTTRSESVEGIEKSPVHRIKTQSLAPKAGCNNESSDGIERNSSVPLRKEVKSEAGDGIEKNAESKDSTISLLVKEKSLNENGIGKESDELTNEIVDEPVEKNPDKIKKIRSDENLEEFGICEEKKEITSNLDNVAEVKCVDDEDWDEIMDEEIEKKSIDVKEVNISEQKKPISPNVIRKQPPLVVIEDKKIHGSNERSAPISSIVRKQPTPVVHHSRIISKSTATKPIPVADEPHRVPETHSKLQSLVDLVMWRDVSRSAFVFGFGTFAIISSSYTRDLNISFISVVSYIGLVYLAAIFIFRSIICRGAANIDDTDQHHVVGEEDAVWLLKLILPFINEFLLKVRALFSGDPSTTMKLAFLLFVLARCGSSITIWKMVKLGFFGVFTLPKVCSSYSSQLTEYGTFWFRRFRDAWDSCSHKKAVALGIFTLVWNLSSIVARIWAVFMLFVAFKYYQQSMLREEWVVEEGASVGGGQGQGQDSWQQGRQIGGQRQGPGPNLMESKKQNKRLY